MTNYSECDYHGCGARIPKNSGYAFYNADFNRETHDDSESFDLCNEHGILIRKQVIGELT